MRSSLSSLRSVCVCVLALTASTAFGQAKPAQSVEAKPPPSAKEYRLAIPDPKSDRSSGELKTVEVAVERVKTDGGYAVVTSRGTYEDKEWRKVVDGLAFKHAAQVLVYDGTVESVRGELARRMPKYTCFVVRPEEANRAFVAHVHRLTRKLDTDPYADTIWGIITGYCPADAARVVSIARPLVVRNGAGGTPISLEKFYTGIWFNEGKQNHGVQKTPDGKIADIKTPDDTTKAIVDTLSLFQPDYFQTSGHATERDWQPGYSYKNGHFACKDGVLFGKDLAGNTHPVNSPNPKIYAAYGNCLIGNIPDKNCMALAWFGSGGAAQMVGYTVVTWYGYGGWGIGNYFSDVPGRFTFAESFYLNNQALVHKLNKQFPARAALEFNDWDKPNWGMSAYQAMLGAGVSKDEFGLHWDRDTVAFYGDPAWHAALKPQAGGWEQSLRWKDDVYTFTIKADESVTFGRPPAALFPHRLKMTRIIEGREFGPVIADNFILLGDLEKIEQGKTYKVVFKASKVAAAQEVKAGAESVPEEKRDDIADALARAGDNKPELIKALRACKPQHREGMAFLIANMPDCDLQFLDARFLLDNVALAYEAVRSVPWGESIPKDVFLNYILPYASVNERRDDWRADFHKSFIKTANSHVKPGDAAVALNSAVFKELGVVYHATKRPKPDQSPYESVEAGYASCTGLSVLLINACRAVGIPARIAGIPLWTDRSGNHNWVEVWQEDKWHALEAADTGPLNGGWFTQKARETDTSKAEHRIYAVSFKKTDKPFTLVWAPSINWVSAVDVTESYVSKSADAEL